MGKQIENWRETMKDAEETMLEQGRESYYERKKGVENGSN